jgi:hypothetical protein
LKKSKNINSYDEIAIDESEEYQEEWELKKVRT